MEKQNILQSSDRILFLLNLLSRGKYSKDEILKEFKKENIEISKTTLNNYLNTIKECSLPLKSIQEKKVHYFTLSKKNSEIVFDEAELAALQDVEKLLVLENNWENTKKALRIFYKLELNFKTREEKLPLMDFGYYSKLNWQLVKELKQHCKEKNIITIDYL
ncbi:hypothetical protein IJ670_08460 [bacterium]|nr:hypothetical protein [bacterium]